MKKGDITKKGFTIIEVALVLAIAGAIFLMIFIALPALRTSQRDTGRRESVISAADNVKKYQSDNRGALPGASDNITEESPLTVNFSRDVSGKDPVATSWAGFYKKYLGENFIDPDGEEYQLLIMKCGAAKDSASCSTSVNDAIASHTDTFKDSNYTMMFIVQAKCSGESVVGTDNPRKLAIVYKLEGAGTYCSNT